MRGADVRRCIPPRHGERCQPQNSTTLTVAADAPQTGRGETRRPYSSRPFWAAVGGCHTMPWKAEHEDCDGNELGKAPSPATDTRWS